MRRFIEWVSDYTISPPGLVARMALRAPAGFEAEPLMQALRITGVKPDRMTAARTRVLELANDGMAWSRSGLSHAAGVSSTVVDGLHAQGVFEVVELPRGPVVPLPDTHYAKTDLSPDQQEASDALAASVKAGAFSVTLLDGVTGSGKTEVYFEAIAAALDAGQAGADPAAGNRPDLGLHRALSGPVRRQARRMAFGPCAENARESLAAGGGGRCARGRRARGRRCICRSRSWA